MKTLLIMRHGKSSWKHKDLTDHERPLAKRGVRDSGMMGEFIREKELTPQLILSSTAIRTIQTAQIFSEVDGFHGKTIALDSLYLAEAEIYIEELKKLSDEFERVMVIGHNPGLETLLQMITGRIEALPTGVIAYVSLPIAKWAELEGDAEGDLIQLWRPKELREMIEEEEEEEEKARKKEKEKKPEKKKASKSK
jgi:phosphohistidine phosphatase